MPMLKASVIAVIEELAPPQYQADWDCSGVQVVASIEEVKKIAVCLDAVPEIVAQAIKLDCDFILAHHPLTLKAELPKQLNSYHEILKLLLCNNVELYSAHTSLDVNGEGPAIFLGRFLQLEDTQVLEVIASKEANRKLGYGEIGDLPAPESLNKLASRLMELLKLNVLPVCGSQRKDIIRRIAYCGGSAASLTERAAQMGADVMITGDVKYHIALESPITILDVGHYSFENEMMRHVTRTLKERLVDVEVIFLESPDPFKFIYKA